MPLVPQPRGPVLRAGDTEATGALFDCGRCARACPRGGAPCRLLEPWALDPRNEAGTEPAPAASRSARAPRPARGGAPARGAEDERRRGDGRDPQGYALLRESGGGATFSGGEPLGPARVSARAPARLPGRGRADRRRYLGLGARELVLEAGGLADLVLFDLKSIDEARHLEATGVPYGPILANLEALAAAGAAVALRVPLIPGFNDASGDLERMASFAASLEYGARVHILAYHGSARGKYELRGAAYRDGRRRGADAEAVARGGPRLRAGRARRRDRGMKMNDTMLSYPSERVKRLREESFSLKPSFSSERAVLTTEFYREREGRVSVPVLRAMNFRNLCEKKAIYIGRGELIVGERGPRPKAVSTYPELTCHSEEDLRILDSRPMASYAVARRTRRRIASIVIPYWRGRSIRDRAFAEIGEDWKPSTRPGSSPSSWSSARRGTRASTARSTRRG